MNLFKCNHNWKERSNIFTPPVTRGFTMNGYGATDIVEKMTMGFTTIILKCSLCGKLNSEDFIGDQRIKKED